MGQAIETALSGGAAQPVCLCAQGALLFSTTIAANIALGGTPAREGDRAGGRIACVHDDIVRFPRGYETEVGEKGVTLSSGQKQRLAIARALLLDAPILVLDDALSAVDAHRAADPAGAQRPQAHPHSGEPPHLLTAVEQADEILVLEQGDQRARSSRRPDDP